MALPCTASQQCLRTSREYRMRTPPPRKGGRFVQGVLGTFDSLNPLIVKGIAPPSMRGYVVESLMARGYDEPFNLYGSHMPVSSCCALHRKKCRIQSCSPTDRETIG